MSLLIEGMKMPEYRDVFGDERGCVYLLVLTVNKDGTAFMQFNDEDDSFHQVKEISAPHGRLIDADELVARIENDDAFYEYGVSEELKQGLLRAVGHIIETDALVELD